MIGDIIQTQIRRGENAETAFFVDESNVDAIAATICAFLNGGGGLLFVGIEKSGKIVGIEEPAEDVRRDLEVYLQKNITPKALFTLSIDAFDEVSLITIEVPQGRDVPYICEGRVLIRDGKETRVADADALRRLVYSRSVEAERWERRKSVLLEEDDLDETELANTVRDARAAQRLDIEPGNIESLINGLNLMSGGQLTNACDVLFASRPSQRHPQCRVRYVVFDTDKVGSSFTDNEWYDGPLASVFYRIMDKIGSQVRIQALFERDDPNRFEHANYSLEALREGLVNAIAHRDYSSSSGGVQVSVYRDRIEIWNSGRLPAELKVGDLKRIHPSIPTNPDIAHVLYLRRLMERVGRGTQKIFAACEELKARPPKWEDSTSGVKLTVYASNHEEALRLNQRQMIAMNTLRPGDELAIRDYIKTMEVSERQARRDLTELEEVGFLTRVGQDRSTVYQRTAKII